MPLRGDVDEGDDRPEDLAVAVDGVRAILDGDGPAIGPVEIILDAEDPYARMERLVDRAEVRRKGRPVGVAVVDELVHVATEDIVGRNEPKQAERRGIAEGAEAGGVDPVDSFADRVEEEPDPRLALLNDPLGVGPIAQEAAEENVRRADRHQGKGRRHGEGDERPRNPGAAFLDPSGQEDGFRRGDRVDLAVDLGQEAADGGGVGRPGRFYRRLALGAGDRGPQGREA